MQPTIADASVSRNLMTIAHHPRHWAVLEALSLQPFRTTEIIMSDIIAPETPNRKTKLTDAFRIHFSGDAPLTEKAKSFAKARPWTSAAFVGVAAVALLNSLRGVRH
jgi:hypothetical protein